MRVNFSLRELETFLAIADYGTFAAAGEAIGLTQSAISLQIKSLETALDTELFDRSKRPPVMNTNGLKLIRSAREVIRQCQAIKDDMQDSQAGGLLRIGVVPSVMSGLLPQTLVQLRKSNPAVQVELNSGLSAELVNKVSRGTLDAALVTEPYQLGRGLSWHAFDEEPLVLIAPSGAEHKVDSKLLEHYPYIQFHTGTYVGQQILTLLKDRGISIKPGMSLDSLESIAVMVANGLGVSIVPQRSIKMPFPDGVKMVEFGPEPVKRVIGVVERVSNPKHDLIALLTEALIEQSGGDPGYDRFEPVCETVIV